MLEELRQSGNDVPVLMSRLRHGGQRRGGTQLGADDYLTKPCDNALLRSKIKSILARREPVLGAGASRIVGGSSKMRDVKRAIARSRPRKPRPTAPHHGTGKELIARALHEGSPRRSAPVLAVNCSALAEGLLSRSCSAMRGAPSPARWTTKGLFEEGTAGVFLDGMDDVSPPCRPSFCACCRTRLRVGTSRTCRWTCA